MTYREISIAGETPRAPIDQPGPMLEWVPVARMVVDESYQRPLDSYNWSAIRKIADNFLWSRFSTVLVAPIENGRFAIIDGQHRVHAAALCGFETVPAMIVNVSRADQASAFAWVNGNVTRMTSLNVFRAAVAAGEAWAVEAARSVADAGCQMMTYNRSSKDKKAGMVFAVALIRQLCEKGHGPNVTAALSALREADEKGDVALWAEATLRPWLWAVALKPGAANADLTSFLRQNKLHKVIGLADSMKTRPEWENVPLAQLRRDSIIALLGQFMKVAA